MPEKFRHLDLFSGIPSEDLHLRPSGLAGKPWVFVRSNPIARRCLESTGLMYLFTTMCGS